jgi:hypothetical protein
MAQRDERGRKERVEKFIRAITDAAIEDHHNGVAEYDPRNSGERLIGRLNLSAHRISPRNGDAKYARSLYTAVRWLYTTETAQTNRLEGK